MPGSKFKLLPGIIVLNRKNAICQFWSNRAFLNGSLYDRISIRTSDDPIKTYYSFDTEPEDEFDEYTHPSIRITLTGKTS